MVLYDAYINIRNTETYYASSKLIFIKACVCLLFISYIKQKKRC